MKSMDAGEILRIIDILLRALGTKLLCILALLMTFALFAWSMYKGSWLGLAIAGTFAFVALLPTLFVAWSGRQSRESGSQE